MKAALLLAAVLEAGHVAPARALSQPWSSAAQGMGVPPYGGGQPYGPGARGSQEQQQQQEQQQLPQEQGQPIPDQAYAGGAEYSGVPGLGYDQQQQVQYPPGGVVPPPLEQSPWAGQYGSAQDPSGTPYYGPGPGTAPQGEPIRLRTKFRSLMSKVKDAVRLDPLPQPGYGSPPQQQQRQQPPPQGDGYGYPGDGGDAAGGGPQYSQGSAWGSGVGGSSWTGQEQGPGQEQVEQGQGSPCATDGVGPEQAGAYAWEGSAAPVQQGSSYQSGMASSPYAPGGGGQEPPAQPPVPGQWGADGGYDSPPGGGSYAPPLGAGEAAPVNPPAGEYQSLEEEGRRGQSEDQGQGQGQGDSPGREDTYRAGEFELFGGPSGSADWSPPTPGGWGSLAQEGAQEPQQQQQQQQQQAAGDGGGEGEPERSWEYSYATPGAMASPPTEGGVGGEGECKGVAGSDGGEQQQQQQQQQHLSPPPGSPASSTQGLHQDWMQAPGSMASGGAGGAGPGGVGEENSPPTTKEEEEEHHQPLERQAVAAAAGAAAAPSLTGNSGSPLPPPPASHEANHKPGDGALMPASPNHVDVLPGSAQAPVPDYLTTEGTAAASAAGPGVGLGPAAATFAPGVIASDPSWPDAGAAAAPPPPQWDSTLELPPVLQGASPYERESITDVEVKGTPAEIRELLERKQAQLAEGGGGVGQSHLPQLLKEMEKEIEALGEREAAGRGEDSDEPEADPKMQAEINSFLEELVKEGAATHTDAGGVAATNQFGQPPDASRPPSPPRPPRPPPPFELRPAGDFYKPRPWAAWSSSAGRPRVAEGEGGSSGGAGQGAGTPSDMAAATTAAAAATAAASFLAKDGELDILNPIELPPPAAAEPETWNDKHLQDQLDAYWEQVGKQRPNVAESRYEAEILKQLERAGNRGVGGGGRDPGAGALEPWLRGTGGSGDAVAEGGEGGGGSELAGSLLGGNKAPINIYGDVHVHLGGASPQQEPPPRQGGEGMRDPLDISWSELEEDSDDEEPRSPYGDGSWFGPS